MGRFFDAPIILSGNLAVGGIFTQIMGRKGVEVTAAMECFGQLQAQLRGDASILPVFTSLPFT